MHSRIVPMDYSETPRMRVVKLHVADATLDALYARPALRRRPWTLAHVLKWICVALLSAQVGWMIAATVLALIDGRMP